MGRRQHPPRRPRRLRRLQGSLHRLEGGKLNCDYDTRKQHTDSTSPLEPFYEDLMMLTACHVLVCNCAEKQPDIQLVVHYSIASTLFLPSCSSKRMTCVQLE